MRKELIEFFPEEYKPLVKSVEYIEEKLYDSDGLYAHPVSVTWENGKSVIYASPTYMQLTLTNNHKPSEFSMVSNR